MVACSVAIHSQPLWLSIPTVWQAQLPAQAQHDIQGVFWSVGRGALGAEQSCFFDAWAALIRDTRLVRVPGSQSIPALHSPRCFQRCRPAPTLGTAWLKSSASSSTIATRRAAMTRSLAGSPCSLSTPLTATRRTSQHLSNGYNQLHRPESRSRSTSRASFHSSTGYPSTTRNGLSGISSRASPSVQW